MNSFFRLLPIVVSALILAACSGGSGALKLDNPDAVTLVLPQSVDVLLVDGNPAKADGLVRPDPYTYSITPGRHIVDVTYAVVWGQGEASELVRSDVYQFDLRGVAGSTYVIGLPEEGSREKARLGKYLRDFTIWADNAQTGSRINGSNVGPYSGGLNGLLGGGNRNRPQVTTEDVPEQMQDTAVDSGSDIAGEIIVVDSELPLVTAVDTSKLAAAPGSETSGEALRQLKSWWQQATQQERGEFLIWSTKSNAGSNKGSDAGSN